MRKFKRLAALAVVFAATTVGVPCALAGAEAETLPTPAPIPVVARASKPMFVRLDEGEEQETQFSVEVCNDQVEVSDDEVELLACVIYQEAGGDACSDLCRRYVGDVVLNRVADSRFPDTLEGVLTQKAQYGRFYWTGVVWPERASNPGEAAAVERAYDTARALLSGEHTEIYGEGYVWQAEFEQGKRGFWMDGIYFGR